jgi:sec-independent protein translocase protein TatA
MRDRLSIAAQRSGGMVRRMPNIGLPEMLVLLVIVLLVVGPKKLPQAGRSLGAGIREFKDSITGTHPDDQKKL